MLWWRPVPSRQLPRRLEIRIARHEMRDLVRVLLVHAVERELREARRGCFVQSFSANDVGHMSPWSRFASSLKPSVAYRALNFCALWKKQTTLPSLA